MKPVRESTQGKMISAYVILDKNNEVAFIIHARYTKGTYHPHCQVDVWDKTSLILQVKGENVANALHGHNVGGVDLFDGCMPHPNSPIWFAKAAALKGKEYRYFEARLRKKYGVRISAPAVYYISGLDRMESFGYKIIHVI